MSPRPKAPRGTYDVLGDEAARRERLEATARDIFEAAGYRRIETPTFEDTELFARGVGEATDIVRKEMFTFDYGSDATVTLRPEGTAPICRAYLEHGMAKLAQPVRLWYLGAFYRRERPQAGRFRQFWQIGAEAIGAADPALDAEVVTLLADVLDAAGVRGLRLRIGSLGSPESRAAYRAELQDYLRSHADRLSDDVRERIDLNPLRAFDADHPGTREVMAGAPLLLDDAGIAYELDPTLVRGLDYYTRTIFEFTSDRLGAQSGVGGGGRYDGLMELVGGPATPGVGWAAGVERMFLAAEERPAPLPVVDVYVAAADPAARRTAFVLAREARRAGLGAQLEVAGRSVKGQLKHADRIGARYVAIVGEAVTLRDMETGEQHDLPAERVVRDILRPLA